MGRTELQKITRIAKKAEFILRESYETLRQVSEELRLLRELERAIPMQEKDRWWRSHFNDTLNRAQAITVVYGLTLRALDLDAEEASDECQQDLIGI